MNTKWAGLLGISGLFFLCVTSYSLQGCRKEPPQAHVEKTVLSNSETQKGHKELGLALYEKGKNAEAIEEFKKAITDNTADVTVYFTLASVYSDEEMIREAIDAYKKVIELEPNHIEAHYNLGFILLDEDSCEEGIKELKKVLEIDPTYEDVSYSLGDAYYACKKIDDAIETWKILLLNDPDDSVLHYNLGLAYRDKRQWELAMSEVEKAIACNPKNEDAKKLFQQLTTKKRGVKRSGNVKSKKRIEDKNK